MNRALLVLIGTAALGCSGGGGWDAASSLDAGFFEPDAGPRAAYTRPPTTAVHWDWQIGAATEADIGVPTGVNLLDVDGFLASAASVASWRARGIYTVCYINAGSWQPGLPDAGDYPDVLKLQADPNWPGEYFLDVTDVFRPGSVLAAILGKRLDMCKAKGFDALEPDNLQNDENVKSGKITMQAQLDFNGWLADLAHAKGLAVFQKNGPDKILRATTAGTTMVDTFDGILDEQCQQFGECDALGEFSKRGKLALDVEYDKSLTLDCSSFTASGIVALKKDLLLAGMTSGAYVRQTCD